jgi:hypothetical protein
LSDAGKSKNAAEPVAAAIAAGRLVAFASSYLAKGSNDVKNKTGKYQGNRI